MLSDAAHKDPSAHGQTNYPRAPLDFYPSPRPVVDALLEVIADDLPAYHVWECCAGTGAIVNPLKEMELGPAAILATDVVAYAGFDPDALVDFFEVDSLDELESILGFIPDAIITNPPYRLEGKVATAKFVKHALKLLKPVGGLLAVVLRHDWDAARGNAALCEHPAFLMKATMKFRPRWIEPVPGEKTKGPRFSYAWYVWSFEKPAVAQPVIRYVG